MKRGGFYNWKGQPERLIYMGKVGCWYQFALVDNPNRIWCEVMDKHMHMIEETFPCGNEA